MPNFLISPKDIYSALDDNGNPLSGGRLYTYVAGSSTPTPTFTDAGGNVENSNPVVLDARGEAPVWLSDEMVYKFVLRMPSPDNTTIRTTDNITANSGGGSVGISFVTHRDSTSIELNGLGTASSPITATALISDLSTNALGITTGGSGGLYVTSLADAVANKLDKVQTGAQSVVSEVAFNSGVDVTGRLSDSSAIRIPDGSWIRPQSAGQAMYLTNGTNPSTNNSTLHLTNIGSQLTSGDGTNQFGSFEQSTTQTDLLRTSGAINIQAGTVSGGSGIVLDDQTGVSILATDVSTSNVFGVLGLNTAGAQLNNGRGSVLDILANQTLLSSVGTSGILIEATNGLLDLKGSTGIKLRDKVTLSSTASETPIKTLGRNALNEVIEFDNVDASDKLDKVQTTAQSVESEVEFKNGVEVSGTLSSGNDIDITNGGKIGGSAHSNYVELNAGYAGLQSGASYVRTSNSVVSLGRATGTDEIVISSTYMNLETTGSMSLESAVSISLDAPKYIFNSIPTGTPSFSYGQNASGELIKYVDGAIATPNLQDVTDEGSTTTNGATFGGSVKSPIFNILGGSYEHFIKTTGASSQHFEIGSGKDLVFWSNRADDPNRKSFIFNASGGIVTEGGATFSGRIIQGGVTDDNTTGILGTSAKFTGGGTFGGAVDITPPSTSEYALYLRQNPAQQAVNMSSVGDGYMGWIGARANNSRRFLLYSSPSGDGSNVGLILYDSLGANAETSFITAHGQDFEFLKAVQIPRIIQGGVTDDGSTGILGTSAKFTGTLTASIPIGTPIGNVGYDATGRLVQGANVDVSLNRTLTLQAPTSADNITIFRTDVAITAQEVIAVSTGTSPSTTYILRHSTDRSAVGNLLTTSGTTTSTTSGDTATLSDSTIPTDSWIWLETSAVSGSNVYLTIDIKYTED
jgi:hypothetical protein